MSHETDMQALGDRILEWREDAVLFVADMWGPVVLKDEQQIRLLRAMSPRYALRDSDGKIIKQVAVKSGHSTGKTTSMSWLTIRDLLIWDRVKVGITSPSGSQMESVIKPEIKHWVSEMPAPWRLRLRQTNDGVYATEGKESERFAEFKLAARDKPESLQGMHAEHVRWYVDEATGVAENLWPYIEACLSDPDAWILAAANPTKKNCRFHRCFGVDREDWQRLTFNSELSSFGGKAFAEKLAKKYARDSDYYRIRVLGEFPNEDYDVLITEALVDGSMSRVLRDADVAHAPVIIGADTNWFGDDPCCVYVRQGLRAQFLGKWPALSTDRFAGLIARFEDEYEADAVIVDCGGSGGGGVVDCLRVMGRKPIPAWFGSTAVKDREFINRRVEMWFAIRDWLSDGGALPDRPDLKADLTGPGYWYAGSGKKQMESKEDMRARGLASPNEGDALALTFYCPVVRRRSKKAMLLDDMEESGGRRRQRRVLEPMDECPFPDR